MTRPRLRNYVLLDHDAAHVIAAEPQAHLTCLKPLRNPGRLHVENIVEVQARDRKCFEVFNRGRLFFDETSERGVLALEGPRNKGREATRVLLDIADYLEMIHPLLQCLATAKHHGCRSAHAERVSSAVHVDPFFRPALEPTNAVADFVVKYLGASTGDRIKSRIAQPGYGVAHAKPTHFRDHGHFGG